MAQSISRHLPRGGDRSRPSPCESCGGQIGTVTDFSPRASVCPCPYFSVSDHIHLNPTPVRRTRRQKTWSNLHIKQRFAGCREYCRDE